MAIMFLSRDIAHKEHLKTESLAEHMALGDFYTGIICLADKFAETYQGRNGIIENYSVLNAEGGKNPAAKLQKMLRMIEDNRYLEVDKNDTAIQNIIDEIVGLYLTTLYKLNNLK